jgi:hypothetical protein
VTNKLSPIDEDLLPNDRLFEMLFEACRSEPSDSSSQRYSTVGTDDEDLSSYALSSADGQLARAQARALYEWGAALESDVSHLMATNDALERKVELLERERDAALELVRQMRAVRI